MYDSSIFNYTNTGQEEDKAIDDVNQAGINWK